MDFTSSLYSQLYRPSNPTYLGSDGKTPGLKLRSGGRGRGLGTGKGRGPVGRMVYLR